MSGLYIHIPFCASRCIYCDFYSTTGRNRSHFIPRLLEEAEKAKTQHGENKELFQFRTLYIGGGTPSQLSSSELNDLFNGLNRSFGLSQLEEVTLEVNPEDITLEYVQNLPYQINRVSMGVQSFVETELKVLHRRHNSKRPSEAVQLLRSHGINNISIDLMYGIPEQTLDSFEYSIKQALELGTQHISAYCLSVEEGARLSNMIHKHEVSIANDELCNDMNACLRSHLHNAGFIQYEISNYALPGFESKHNSSYWDTTPYLGLGPGAHSYDGKRLRWWNDPDLTLYLQGNNRQGYEQLTIEDCYNELIMLGLRTRKGVNTVFIEKNYHSLYQSHFLPEYKKLINERLLVQIDEFNIRLSEEGLTMADAIIRRLMCC